MPPRNRLTAVPAATTPAPAKTAWERQWAQVPELWREPAYKIDAAPYREVFTQNANYQPGRTFTFAPDGPDRLGQEVAWWVWTCWAEGLRKIEPAMLRWWQTALTSMAKTRHELTGTPVTSIADFDPGLVTREATRQFHDRNGRQPSPGNLKNLRSIAEHAHLLVSVRCGDRTWWEHNVWDMRIDNRIPRREHEPQADRAVRLIAIQPVWLREGIRFWMAQSLTHDLYTWSSVRTRVHTVGGYFGKFCTQHGIASPLTVTDPATQLRQTFMAFLSWLRSPEATQNGRDLLAKTGVASTQSMVQGFYEFMHDHRDEAAVFTGDDRWRDIGVEHTRLWAPEYGAKRVGNQRELTYITTTDMQRMVPCLDILGAPTSDTVTITLPGGTTITAQGLGDEQAMRAWLLQAMTGRRASEILMLDYNPITMIDGLDTADAPDDAFVARLRYQQTKVDGIDPTILIEQATVNIIREQQQWATNHLGGTQPKYLFLNPRHNHRGLRARAYASYLDALRRLDTAVALTDTDNRPLRFTQTHRLRYTRATELLNAGVPVHVVQRYLGHKSPEMTMRYAATLASTAEAEFLRYKKIGADGRDLDIAPRDIYEMAQLDRRTDRILPNGVCLLPPAKTCDKGNACLPCGHYATDRTHLEELQAQHRHTLLLIDQRQKRFQERNGAPMTPDNVWLAARQRELNSLNAIITRLQSDDLDNDAVRGAGTTGRADHPGLLQIDTSGIHNRLLHPSPPANTPEDGTP